ncbi:unnamed protein product [Ixodes persulcatus]
MGPLFRIASFQHALLAFRGTLTARAQLNVIEGRKLVLEIGQLEGIPAAVVLSETRESMNHCTGVEQATTPQNVQCYIKCNEVASVEFLGFHLWQSLLCPSLCRGQSTFFFHITRAPRSMLGKWAHLLHTLALSV